MTPWVTNLSVICSTANAALQFGHGGDAVGDPDVQAAIRQGMEGFNSATAVTPWVTFIERTA